TGLALSAPSIAIGDEASDVLTPVALKFRGMENDARFTVGAGGFQTLSLLGAGQVWATLIPQGTTYVNASVAGASFQGQLSSNGVGYLSPVRPTLTNSTVPGFDAVAASSDGNNVYGVTTTQDGRSMLVVVNRADGSQRQFFADEQDGVTALGGARDVAARGSQVYVASPTDGKIAVFDYDGATRDLTFSLGKTVSEAGVTSLTFNAAGDRLYVTNGAGVVRYNVATDGALSARTVLISGFSDINKMTLSADGTRIFAASDSLNSVGVWTSSGTPIASAAVADPGSVAAYSDGSTGFYVYVASPANSALSAFHLTGTTLAPLQTLTNGVDGIRGMAGASDVQVSSDGKFVFVAGPNDNGIAAFIVGADGTLQFTQVVRNNVAGASNLWGASEINTDPQDSARLLIASAGATGAAGGYSMMSVATGVVPPPATYTTQFSGIESLTVETGEQSDVIRLVNAPGVATTSTTIKTNGGDDSIVVQAVRGSLSIDSGADDDGVQISAAASSSATLSVSLGAGADSLELLALGNAINTSVNAGADDDKLTIQAVSGGASTTTKIEGGSGADEFFVSGNGIPASV
ncbi:MAG TPA: beta-propeller fold lactonase family protein, partial [Myxococcota bacterium]